MLALPSSRSSSSSASSASGDDDVPFDEEPAGPGLFRIDPSRAEIGWRGLEDAWEVQDGRHVRLVGRIKCVGVANMRVYCSLHDNCGLILRGEGVWDILTPQLENFFRHSVAYSGANRVAEGEHHMGVARAMRTFLNDQSRARRQHGGV